MKKRLIALLIIAVILSVLTFSALKKTERQEYTQTSKIIRVWHIDTFAGGKGSRADFLKNRALEFEQRNDVFVMVTAHTQESFLNAVAKGEKPDVVSYGIGIEKVLELAKPLKGLSFSGGNAGGDCYAYPWCQGRYCIITKDGYMKTDKTQTVISLQKGALAEIAFFDYISAGGVKTADSQTAYEGFIGGKYDVLLGTQRDVNRLIARNISFSVSGLSDFNDLYQYFSVCAEKNNYSASLAFINYILSETSQSKLSVIGMLSINRSIYGTDNALSELETSCAKTTLSAFTTSDSRENLRNIATKVSEDRETASKKIQNVLINV